MTKLRVDVWSDIVCPWCYIGKRRLERALDLFPHRAAVAVTWRAFELDPSAPPVRELVPYAERLGKKYGTTSTQAQEMIDRMVDVAKTDGLEFRFDRIRPGNTFDAHRLLHLAGAHDAQDTLKERFLRAYMTEGEAIGDPQVLTKLAVQAGLDADDVASVLMTDTYAREVREDEAEARENGISGVPFFVIGRYGVSGAQPAETLVRVLTKAWDEATAAPEPVTAGTVCGPDGCF